MDSLPPDPDLGRTMVVITVLLHLISIPLYCGRMYGRLRPVLQLSWDSYFLTGAVVLLPSYQRGKLPPC